MDYVGRQLELSDMLFIVDHPRDFGSVEAVLVHEHAAQPYAGGDRVSSDADFFAFEVLRHSDIRIRSAYKTLEVKIAHQENRQRFVWRAISARAAVRSGGHFADI